ncbi:D-beta-hydroxybutyrate dehydrogenase, mitochondrial [Halyomorpha halys]|uniref:D-beta-hydroxybutyrate dehydrogenase, mitochondrial n=1 Tax=Halyomorpha halys TaxID=286706 RepID=UPI0006D4F25C|nr:D-beta-hydroxybutyrate dehydrogenase, mitochondrial [Halyomorpha halys]XP_014270870.1 D-beta-hydroxybutyrate dehydrogenase, mitochondrial [Halyomorpha halys]
MISILLKMEFLFTFVGLVAFTVLTIFTIMYRINRFKTVKINRDSVFITGCDSGIGLYFAKHLASLGCTVFAGVLDLSSAGVNELLGLRSKGEIRIIKVDVTKDGNIKNCLQEVEQEIFKKQLELITVINNAGVMVFGEFEWQTDEQIMRQINVNLLGYMKVAKTFLPLLHKFNGRLINVSSHCSLVPLPCLSVYSATKSAIEAWSSSLAVELHKFNLPVITILPGSYVQQSGILKNHQKQKLDMWQEMSFDQKALHKGCFDSVMDYMSAVYNPGPINDPALLSILNSAIFSYKPKQTYINSPWRYSLYHNLINMAGPFKNLRRFLILSYISLPKYK